MTTNHPLAEFRHRRDPRMSIRELAAILGVRPNTVWRWEAGRLPDRNMWPVIKEKTGVRAEDLARFAAGETD